MQNGRINAQYSIIDKFITVSKFIIDCIRSTLSPYYKLHSSIGSIFTSYIALKLASTDS